MIARILLAAAFALALPAHAQGYPSRPIKIIDAAAPGGGSDIQSRLLAERLQAKLAQPVIVENRPGAAGLIAAEAVFRAEPDGYTLLTALPQLVINKLLRANLIFDVDAFVPVALVTEIPNVLMVHPKVGVNSVQELIALAKANPDRLNYASQGIGSSGHLSGELLKSMSGIKIVHVPFKGVGPALIELMAGRVDMTFANLGASIPHIRQGKLRALAVGSEMRSSLLPGVPTMSEALQGFSSVVWYGFVAPPKTPPEIAKVLSEAIADVLKQPKVAKTVAEMGAIPYGSTPAEMGAYMKQEAERWEKVIRASGVKVD